MKSFSDWLSKVSTGWVALAGLVVFLAFTILVLPAQSAAADAQRGTAPSPDLSFFYTPSDLYAMAEAYSVAGRANYIRERFTFDLFWPLVYTFFMATAISWLAKRTCSPQSRWRRLNLVPVLGAIFDYLENLSTSLVMARYPAHTPLVDILAPVFTVVKWTFVGGGFVLVFVGLGVMIWRRIRSG
jgi:hypothetical protein